MTNTNSLEDQSMWNYDIHWMHEINIICGIVLGTIFFFVMRIAFNKKGDIFDWFICILGATVGAYFSDVLLWMVRN
jgi:membrane-anchored protein YejM (alkaline phosphatase superfamily)